MGKTGHETVGDNVYPINYALSFEPDMKRFTTRVHSRISCFAKRPTRKIVLNAKETEVESAFVVFGFRIQPTKIKVDDKKETLSILLDHPVSGNFEIEINSVCKNNDRMYGFYKSKYSYKGKDQYLLTTQFEPANARAAFPCFDEPQFKATYEVSLKIPKELDALSNMPVLGTKAVDGKLKIVSFGKTVRMSTYLLYLFVGRYESIEDRLGRLKLRIIATPGNKDRMRLPMVYAKKFIAWYENYFGIAFPLPKIDFIAIPDFAAGAMENWGAITFRETALLCDEKTPIALKQQIAEVIAHELAHQWFGDLVTMEWWDDLWLNESFATFMAMKAIDPIYPAWDYEVQYVDDTLGTAFAADSLKSTHPISVHVNNPYQIDAIFDRISYEKGGSVLYMLEDYVGKEVLRKGLNIYLKRHAYTNARKEHLWEAIEEAARRAGKKVDVSGLMSKWITKAGHPIVDVKKSDKGFALSQKRYTISADIEGTWPIPIHFKSASGTGKVTMTTKTLDVKSGSGWIKLNYAQKGLYRVRYSTELSKSLGNQIKAGRLGMLDAWGVENDLFSLVASGRVAMQEYLDFVDNYCENASFPLNQNVAGHLGGLYRMCYGAKEAEVVKGSLLKFNRALIKRLGWMPRRGERDTDTMLRTSVISRLGIVGDKQTLRKAARLYSGFANGGREIDPNIRSTIYALAAWAGDAKTYEFLLKKYRGEKRSDEQRRFMGALASFRDKKLLGKALLFSKSKEVRLQDSFVIPAIMSGNLEGSDLIWPWTKKNWRHYMKIYGGGTHMLPRYVENLSITKDEKAYSEIRSFFSKKANVRDDIRLGILQTKERIEANMRFAKRNLK
ncbi:MAG: M1 family metallopeptidase [Candidatus Micrarchaeota archaeon]|nr:M1 family metallopeptidase [Candidatus Micrarchaeota archaeon]